MGVVPSSFCESDAYGPSAIPASPAVVFLEAGVAAQVGEEGPAADHQEHQVVVSWKSPTQSIYTRKITNTNQSGSNSPPGPYFDLIHKR